MNIKTEDEYLNWHLVTFPDDTEMDVMCKLREELCEVVNEMSIHDKSNQSGLRVELADTAIVCIRLAHMYGASINTIFLELECDLEEELMEMLAMTTRRDAVLYHLQKWLGACWHYTDGKLWDLVDKKMDINKKRDWSQR